MNETTTYLAQLIGPITLLLSLSFLFKAKVYMEWFKHVEKTQPYLFLQGIVESTVGLALVLNHNLWGSAPEIIISFLGWAMIMEGSMALLTSDKSIKKSLRKTMSVKSLQGVSGAMIILGAYLTWAGYFM